MTDVFSCERRTFDYLFPQNSYNQNPDLPLHLAHHMDDFVTVDTRKYGRKMFFKYKNRIWRSVLFPHEFKSKELEKLFRLYAYPVCFDGLRCLLILMIALTVSLAIVNFVFVSRLSLENIANSSLCLSFVVILICIHTRFMTHRLVSVVTILVVMLCIIFCGISFAVDEQTLAPGFDHKINPRRIMSGGFTFSRVEAVWRICYVTLVLYAFVPLKFYLPLGVALFVSLLHSLLAVFLPSYQPILSPVLSKQVIANMFLFLIVNTLCAYLYQTREKELRSIFNLICSSTALQLQLQDENDKGDKLLASMVPTNIALEMKGDLQTHHLRDLFQKVYMQKYDNISILFGDIMGLSLLSSKCSALEVVRFLNEAIGRLDQLAAENHCQRIQLQGDRYFCACGILDQRPDHAKCCTEMGIDMIDFINFVGNLTLTTLKMRVGVHTGHVMCGVVGVQNWHYDMWGEHVEIASLVEKAGQPGKVLVTETTMQHLHGEFQVVINKNNCSKLESLGVKTYFIFYEHSRKHYFLPKCTPTTKNIGGVLSAIKFNIEQPLSNIVSRTFISSNNSFEDADFFIASKSSSKQIPSFSERHKKHLVQMIVNKSIKKKKTEYVNYLSLSFKSLSLQRSFQALEDLKFASKLFLALIILVMSMVIHALILPRTIFLLVFFLVCFAWISVVLMLVLGYRIRCIGCDVRQSSLARRSIVLISILLHYVMSFLNTLCCRGGIVFPERVSSPSESVVSFHHPTHLDCPSPQYIYLNVLPCLFLVNLFSCLTVSLKLSIWLLMSVGFLMVMEFANRTFFFNYDSKLGSEIPSDAPGILMLLHFVIALYLGGRDMDWQLRLKHIWHDHVRKQKLDVDTLENLNQDLFHNLLPDHVVPYFDNVPENKIIDFYSHSYSRVAVMQASVTNLSQIFSDMTKKSRNTECLREIISAFDRVQQEPRFTSTTKIKSSGPSYLVVAGLKPNNKIDDTRESKRLHLNILIELALKMKESLLPICRGRLTFMAGIDLGPAIVGVIGAKKPQYEIIGDCINLACLLNASSIPNCIQVTEDVYKCVNGYYEFKCRGITKLKNSKEQLTYILGTNPVKPTTILDFEKDEGLVSAQLNMDKNQFIELPSFDHSIKKPQPITPHTPSKVQNGCPFSNFFAMNFHLQNDDLSAFSSKIHSPRKSLESHLNQVEPYSFNLHKMMEMNAIKGGDSSQPRGESFQSAGYRSNHTSAFIPAGGFNGNNLPFQNYKTQRFKHNLFDNDLLTTEELNDGNNNHCPDHSHSYDHMCSQFITLVDAATTGNQMGTDQKQPFQSQDQCSLESDVENISKSCSWKSEGDISGRKSILKDIGISLNIDENQKCMQNPSICFLASDREDMEAIIKEIGDHHTKHSDICLSERQENSSQEENLSEAPNQSEISEEDGLVHVENGIIYTKTLNNSHLSYNQLSEGNKPYANVPKVRPLIKKCRDGDSLFESANGFIKPTRSPTHLLQSTQKSAFIAMIRDDNSNGTKPCQNVRNFLHNSTNVPLAETLLSANLTARLGLHQVSNKSDLGHIFPKTSSQNQHRVGSNSSRHSMALPSQRLKERWGHTDLPSRSKSLDRVNVGVSDELNSSSSPGDSSPKMLQRTSNRRNIASLCANGSSGENRNHLGSGLFHAKRSQNQKSKLRSNHIQQALTVDCLSLSSFGSEISRSDPALSCESSSAIESEYDNYRPGMASDEDYFAVEPVSDIEIDIFDKASINHIKVDEDYENYNFVSLMSKEQ